ncbi:MAG: hypothetical protein KDI75_04645, partial [Xanthomonadales bacterium]|nr:hypothetical protein [Xanthomonadales bacterium]
MSIQGNAAQVSTAVTARPSCGSSGVGEGRLAVYRDDGALSCATGARPNRWIPNDEGDVSIAR